MGSMRPWDIKQLAYRYIGSQRFGVRASLSGNKCFTRRGFPSLGFDYPALRKNPTVKRFYYKPTGAEGGAQCAWWGTEEKRLLNLGEASFLPPPVTQDWMASSCVLPVRGFLHLYWATHSPLNWKILSSICLLLCTCCRVAINFIYLFLINSNGTTSNMCSSWPHVQFYASPAGLLD